MVCLLNCPGFIIGTPTSSTKAVSNTWPESCKGKVYCDVKPHDYPSDGYLINLYNMACYMIFHGNLASPVGCRVPRDWPEKCANQAYCFDIPTNYPRTPELKKMLDNSIDPIYMIKDANNAVRYVVQDPNLLNQTVSLQPCKEQVDLNARTTCEEDLGPSEFLVMSCDGKRVEKINHMIPIGCSLREVIDYDYNY